MRRQEAEDGRNLAPAGPLWVRNRHAQIDRFLLELILNRFLSTIVGAG